jgi:hypothetical protein
MDEPRAVDVVSTADDMFDLGPAALDTALTTSSRVVLRPRLASREFSTVSTGVKTVNEQDMDPIPSRNLDPRRPGARVRMRASLWEDCAHTTVRSSRGSP